MAKVVRGRTIIQASYTLGYAWFTGYYTHGFSLCRLATRAYPVNHSRLSCNYNVHQAAV